MINQNLIRIRHILSLSQDTVKASNFKNTALILKQGGDKVSVTSTDPNLHQSISKEACSFCWTEEGGRAVRFVMEGWTVVLTKVAMATASLWNPGTTALKTLQSWFRLTPSHSESVTSLGKQESSALHQRQHGSGPLFPKDIQKWFKKSEKPRTANYY